MKRSVFIGLIILLALASCHQAVESLEPAVAKHSRNIERSTPMIIPSPELSVIDSLMWRQADSALMRLIPWFDTCKDAAHHNATDETFDRHYANLLLSELLYKNDYPQTNRPELQQAVPYFDSLVRQAPPTSLRAKRGNPRGPRGLKTPNPTDNLFFLSARAHYINGVGHYEQSQVAEACAEYQKALEVMESHFGEKELVGKKAKFMAYTYNRLGEMFSAQFMMEPAIVCNEQSLVYNRIAPTSPFGTSNTLYRLGLQYNKLGQKEKASEYYRQAFEALPVLEGMLYMDIIATKAFCDYQLGSGMEQPLNTLRQVLAQAESEKEVTGRCLPIGYIFFEEEMYDSALVYLEPVFEHDENLTRRIQAADFLRIIYDSMGQKDKAGECMRFLATHKKSEGENKALVSQLEGLFQDYLNQKQQQKAAQEKREAVLRTVIILLPIALTVATVIILAIRRRGKERLAAQEQTHRMEQAAMSGRLKRSNQEVRELKDQIKQLDDLAAKTEPAASFGEEPICRLIMERVKEGRFKSKIDYLIYKDSALDKQQLLDLRLAVDRHFGQFTMRLKKAYPELTNSDFDYCCLYLLGLTDADIAALMQRTYNTVFERNGKIRKIFGSENPLPITLMGMAKDSLSI